MSFFFSYSLLLWRCLMFLCLPSITTTTTTINPRTTSCLITAACQFLIFFPWSFQHSTARQHKFCTLVQASGLCPIVLFIFSHHIYFFFSAFMSNMQVKALNSAARNAILSIDDFSSFFFFFFNQITYHSFSFKPFIFLHFFP